VPAEAPRETLGFAGVRLAFAVRLVDDPDVGIVERLGCTKQTLDEDEGVLGRSFAKKVVVHPGCPEVVDRLCPVVRGTKFRELGQDRHLLRLALWTRGKSENVPLRFGERVDGPGEFLGPLVVEGRGLEHPPLVLDFPQRHVGLGVGWADHLMEARLIRLVPLLGLEQHVVRRRRHLEDAHVPGLERVDALDPNAFEELVHEPVGQSAVVALVDDEQRVLKRLHVLDVAREFAAVHDVLGPASREPLLRLVAPVVVGHSGDDVHRAGIERFGEVVDHTEPNGGHHTGLAPLHRSNHRHEERVLVGEGLHDCVGNPLLSGVDELATSISCLESHHLELAVHHVALGDLHSRKSAGRKRHVGWVGVEVSYERVAGVWS